MWMFFKRQEAQVSTAFFAACVLLMNLPNFLWLESRSTLLLDGTEFVERLLLCLLLTAVFLTLFTRPWRAWLVLWLLCLWWQPLALGVRAINGMPICRIPDDCIDKNRYPLFMARSVLRELIESLPSTRSL